jgi:hypothetical protein
MSYESTRIQYFLARNYFIAAMASLITMLPANANAQDKKAFDNRKMGSDDLLKTVPNSLPGLRCKAQAISWWVSLLVSWVVQGLFQK